MKNPQGSWNEWIVRIKSTGIPGFQRSKKALAIATAAAIIVWGCAKEDKGLNWQEDVLLPDGHMVVVTRHEVFEGAYEMGSSPNTSEQWFEFVNPSSGEKIKFEARDAYAPVVLFYERPTFYVLVKPALGGIQAKEGCPHEGFVIFKYENGTWRRPPYSPQLSTQEVLQNMTLDPKARKKEIAALSFHLDANAVVRLSHTQWGRMKADASKVETQAFDCPAEAKPNAVAYPAGK